VQHAAWIALHLAGYDNRARVLDTYRWPWPMKKPPDPFHQGRAQRNSIGAPSPARVTLPNDLSGSLKYLDDAQLNRLLEAVTVVWANRALLDEGPMVRIRLSPAASQRRTPFGTVRIQEFDARAVGLTPTGKRRLFTAHADSSRLRAQVINAAGEIWLASDATPAC
jgi:hypothetical protein